MGCCQVPTPVENDGTKGASKEQTGYYDMVNETILNIKGVLKKARANAFRLHLLQCFAF